jgi:hypothetical protein
MTNIEALERLRNYSYREDYGDDLLVIVSKKRLVEIGVLEAYQTIRPEAFLNGDDDVITIFQARILGIV